VGFPLNESAWRRCQPLLANPTLFHAHTQRQEGGAQLIDCGVFAAGGVEAGLAMAEVCLAGLGTVSLVPGRADVWPGPAVCVRTDHPVAACMASQYAGWQVAGGKYFAMGSGPMRAARGREPLFDDLFSGPYCYLVSVATASGGGPRATSAWSALWEIVGRILGF